MPLARFRFSPSNLPRALHVFPPSYWKDERDLRPLRRREGRSLQGENRSRDTGESGRKQGNAEENSEKQGNPEDNKAFNKKRGANNVIDSKI